MTALPPHDDELAAIRAALSLTSLPPFRRQLRKAALPEGMDLLLSVAVDGGAAAAVATRLQRSPQQIMEAAGFFIEQIMLAPGGDSYRTLGGSRETPSQQLRQHFVYLCKWIHAEERDGFTAKAYLVKITQAWNNIKTPDRRAAYDQSLDAHLSPQASGDDRKARGWGAQKSKRGSSAKASVLHGRTRIGVRRKRRSLISRIIAFAIKLKF
ncbi:hypothetical protein [Methylocystis echinoides]|jgi:hypothetical protein|uniref:hypothetical protein n=1 Tax=Methylocystis echinoides TaxID=29468 RepID=UPI0034484ABC